MLPKFVKIIRHRLYLALNMYSNLSYIKLDLNGLWINGQTIRWTPRREILQVMYFMDLPHCLKTLKSKISKSPKIGDFSQNLRKILTLALTRTLTHIRTLI